jgi:hypothetical protein
MPGHQWYDIPAGTRAGQCRGRECRETIYFVDNGRGNGKTIPISCDVDGSFEPTDSAEGRGVSHFGTCVNANDFSRRDRERDR